MITTDIEARLKGTQWGHIAQELFNNTAYFPITKILLELFGEGAKEFLLAPDFYALVIGAFLQAYFLGTWQFKGTPMPLAGNLIGPSLYTLVEVTIERSKDFFFQPSHYTYWIFSVAIGVLQQLRLYLSGKSNYGLTLLENLVRTNILLVGYWIVEARDEAKYSSFSGFLSDQTHIFIVVIISLIGLIIGISNVNAQLYLDVLRKTAAQLRLYSEWLLGRDLLCAAVSDPATLTLQRQERTILFADIRGFTNWSESQPPEKVVNMLNVYFETAEQVWSKYNAIKSKLSGDEIMLVFATPVEAAQAAVEMNRVIEPILNGYGLSTGIGISSGTLAEGLLGSSGVKGYDVIGDTVNTASRICDSAAGGETLISHSTYTALGDRAVVHKPRHITVRGKNQPIIVYPLDELKSGDVA